MKRTPADIVFSKCIRERANWTCERCERYFPEGIARAGLDCSHYHGRGAWATRFFSKNAIANCYGCHSYLGTHRDKFDELMIKIFGQDTLDLLLKLKNNTANAKYLKKNKKDVARHFREQHKIMEKKRNDGFTGYLLFEDYE